MDRGTRHAAEIQLGESAHIEPLVTCRSQCAIVEVEPVNVDVDSHDCCRTPKIAEAPFGASRPATEAAGAVDVERLTTVAQVCKRRCGKRANQACERYFKTQTRST